MLKYQYILWSLLIMSCGNKTSESMVLRDSLSTDSLAAVQTETKQDSVTTEYDEPDPYPLLTTRLSDGKIHEFYQVYSDYGYNLHTRIKGEQKSEIISFAYDRYHDNEPFYTEGFPTPFRYFVSKDKKFIYVIGDIQANSNGWVTEYQIFKVDVETKKSRFLVDCAAIEVVSDGFIVAQARCTNADTARGTYEENWVMHDEKIDFDGNIVYVSKKEYSYEVMTEKFHSGIEYLYIKGFRLCPHSPEAL